MNKVVTAASAFVLVWIVGYLLIAGRGLIVPFILAIFIWHLLNTINNALHRVPFVGKSLPHGLGMFFSLLLVSVFVKLVVDIIANNVNEVILASSRYQENLQHIFNSMDQKYHIKAITKLDSVLENINVQNILLSIYGVFTTLTGYAVWIVLFVIFLFIEQHYFQMKINALFPQKVHRKLVNNILSHIVQDTQTYLGLKTLLSLSTAFFSWIIMKSVGLDFAEFWALLIFFLNFIPNIGAILATFFPAILALVQFQTWWPFLVITSGVVAIQFVVGNLLEPKFMGKSLNLSALVILIALGIWGSIWGILGMILSVPIMVMMMIVFAHFEKTRSIAILLSQDGNIKKLYETV